MIRAGSMTYAIFVSVITAILCTMMIVMAFMNRSFFIHSDRYEKTYDNAISGINLGLNLLSTGNYEQWHNLYSEGSDSVLIKKRPWGIYRVIASVALINGVKAQKALIAGYHSEKISRTALWMADQNKPLQISGDALLKGDCFLPSKGLERAYIEGQNYSRDEMVYGQKNTSSSHIPEPGADIVPYWKNYLNKQYTDQDSLLDMDKSTPHISHSFDKKTMVLLSNNNIDLSSFSLHDNIIIQSASHISVHASSILNNVILIAPSIEIGEGFRGSVHLISSDSVMIREQVQMEYPSSVLMISSNKTSPRLKIEKDTEIRACILSTADKNIRTNDLAIEILPGALVTGWIYCQGNFELNGKVHGSVICNKFLLSTPSGIYENHLLNGQINRELLPEEFSGFAIKDWKNTMKMISWVD